MPEISWVTWFQATSMKISGFWLSKTCAQTYMSDLYDMVLFANQHHLPVFGHGQGGETWILWRAPGAAYDRGRFLHMMKRVMDKIRLVSFFIVKLCCLIKGLSGLERESYHNGLSTGCPKRYCWWPRIWLASLFGTYLMNWPVCWCHPQPTTFKCTWSGWFFLHLNFFFVRLCTGVRSMAI